MLEYLVKNQLFQFVLTLIIVACYFATVISKTPDDVLRSLVTLMVSYWFVGITTKPQVETMNATLQDIHSKVSTSEIQKVQ